MATIWENITIKYCFLSTWHIHSCPTVNIFYLINLVMCIAHLGHQRNNSTPFFFSIYFRFVKPWLLKEQYKLLSLLDKEVSLRNPVGICTFKDYVMSSVWILLFTFCEILLTDSETHWKVSELRSERWEFDYRLNIWFTTLCPVCIMIS